MDLALSPNLCCAAAGIIAIVGAVVGLVLAALVSRRPAILTWIWSFFPAAGLAVGAWAWWPVMVVLERVAGPEVWRGRGDGLFSLIYLGSPVVGTVAGIVAATLIARRYEARARTNEPEAPDDWHPPDSGDVARIVGGL